ncbi:MAG: MobA/MobL family protein [Mariprofundus sp.]
MAEFHMSLKIGSKGKAGPHHDYICAVGKYAAKQGVEHIEHGNMPCWATASPALFWAASDQYERANGTAYRELEVALPRELPLPQQIKLAQQLAEEACGTQHAYSFAIHHSRASDGNLNPHVHLQFSERTDDGHERDPAHYFKRADKKQPERGGCVKDRSWQAITKGYQKYGAEASNRLLEIREKWATMCNASLEAYGSASRVDHRSHAERGIDRIPQPKVGAQSWHLHKRTGVKNERFIKWEQVVASNNAIITHAVRKPSAQEKHSDAIQQLKAAQRCLAALQPVRRPDRKAIIQGIVESQKHVARLADEIWQLEHVTKHKAYDDMKQVEWKRDSGDNWLTRAFNRFYWGGTFNLRKEEYENVLMLKTTKSKKRERLIERLRKHPFAINQASDKYDSQLERYRTYHHRKTELEQTVKSAHNQVRIYENLLPRPQLQRQRDTGLHLSL